MVLLRDVLEHALNLCNAVTVVYFFLGNGIYTLLMAISLASAVAYNRRIAYQPARDRRSPGAEPPLTVLIPAFNEEASIVETVHSALRANYPDLSVVVVDDGSSDRTLERLSAEFKLSRLDLIYRPVLPTQPVETFYVNPDSPRLVVLGKRHGGKSDALNAGINFARSPYFCTLDADSLLEPDALARLMRPVVYSAGVIVASGGIIRIRNGCRTRRGQVEHVRLPQSWTERFQVVEYLRSFLFGRAGWGMMEGTLIVSGAMAVFHRETVVAAGGFDGHTVAEDMELIVRLHRWSRQNGRAAKMRFTLDTVCWTECPNSLAMLARQRRRWQLGLCQVLWLNSAMLFNPRYGVVGMLSFPFHASVEGLGAAVEMIGYFAVPLAFAFHLALSSFYLSLVILSLVYASFLSVGAVLLEEITYRRYPAKRDLYVLLAGAALENFGYRQLVVYWRFQGFLRFLIGRSEWEPVARAAEAEAEAEA